MQHPHSKSTPKKILGFTVTPEEERRARAVIRSSIMFFQNYGKGDLPRLHGEYYTPKNNAKNNDNTSKWLPLYTAAIYCGCKPEAITMAAQEGTIERRAYKRCVNRYYYEYNIADLDEFIKRNNLL